MASNPNQLITEAELAALLRRSRRQLQRDRAERRGCPFVAIGGQIRYRLVDVERFIAQHVIGGATASDPASPARRSRTSANAEVIVP